MTPIPIVTGYYRYTDIWHDWHAVLNPEDGVALKAILAHDALVHIDHPIHIEGVEGAQLYIGTFMTGESRLLFSSKQVEYVRYWLHAVGLTKSLIPLPYSNCLLTTSDLRNVSTQNYKTGGELRFAIRVIDKNNKRLKNSKNPPLTSRRHLFERVRTFWQDKRSVWCALDFEGWEMEHELITEAGWSLVRWEMGEEIREEVHLIVQEHEKFVNGKYVPHQRDNYRFGRSEVVSKAVFKEKIQNLISGLGKYGAVFLVFHDNQQDIKYLQSKMIQLNLDGVSYMMPDATPDNGIFVVDTSDLFGALEGEGNNRRSLEQMCRHLQIPTEYLHNAGNDAHYTLAACKEMASGDAVDIQRDKRWPNRTASSGVKVEFKPWEENSDYSDEEGIF